MFYESLYMFRECHCLFFERRIVNSSVETLLYCFNSKILQQFLVHILGCEASVCQITIYVSPFSQTTIIEHL